MKKILIMDGPNMNMLGVREPDLYGTQNYEDLKALVADKCGSLGLEYEHYQSNYEGDLITKIQQAYFDGVQGIVFNPAGYTFTSVALLDALKAVQIPTVEVHVTEMDKREDFRQHSYIALFADKVISGQGLDGYAQAIDYLCSRY